MDRNANKNQCASTMRASTIKRTRVGLRSGPVSKSTRSESGGRKKWVLPTWLRDRLWRLFHLVTKAFFDALLDSLRRG